MGHLNKIEFISLVQWYIQYHTFQYFRVVSISHIFLFCSVIKAGAPFHSSGCISALCKVVLCND